MSARNPCATLQITAWPGAERWVPTQVQQRKIACLLSGTTVVEYVPRSRVADVWARDHSGAPFTLNPFNFRAYARGGRTTLFVDPTETQDSATWLLLHELAHIELSRSKMLKHAYRSIPKPKGYLTSDVAHESHPEEKLANQVANSWAAYVGIRPGLDRHWWRRRVNAHQGRPARRLRS